MMTSFTQPNFQPRSQGLSSLTPLVVGRKTLVAAGYVTTQNLGGKKTCWMGGVLLSLRSKRSCAFLAKEKPRNLSRSASARVLAPPPRFIFCALPIFRAAKTRGLFSFRLKRTGTLATQARCCSDKLCGLQIL